MRIKSKPALYHPKAPLKEPWNPKKKLESSVRGALASGFQHLLELGRPTEGLVVFFAFLFFCWGGGWARRDGAYWIPPVQAHPGGQGWNENRHGGTV